VELALAGEPAILNNLITIVHAQKQQLSPRKKWRGVADSALWDVLNSDAHESAKQYRAVAVSRVGCYGDPVADSLIEIPVTEEQVRSAIGKVNSNF